MSRRRGFTLIELLVVIAIIGILAAMLFPVFARARESARKTQCLANVKNIATALNMYFADWDRGFPTETNRRVIDYFNSNPGGGTQGGTYPHICNRTKQANPYLRTAVMLEDYVKSVDVWKCPSARVMNGAGTIVPMGPNGDWVQLYKDHEGEWGILADYAYGPCGVAWPPGWGGDVTDSFTQGRTATAQASEALQAGGAGAGVFIQGVGINESLYNLNLSNVQDAGRYLACGDCGKQVDLWATDGVAYPDTCRLNWCGGTSCPAACSGADWTNCGWTRICGLPNDLAVQALSDPSYRKQFTRHMGGSNVGFLDGHAKWHLADVIMTQSEPFEDPYFEGGLCSCWPGNGMW